MIVDTLAVLLFSEGAFDVEDTPDAPNAELFGVPVVRL